MRTQARAGAIVGGTSAIHNDIYDPPAEREFEYGGLRRWDAELVRSALASIESSLTIEYHGFEDLEDMPLPHYYVATNVLDGLGIPHNPRGTGSVGKTGLSAGWRYYRRGSNGPGLPGDDRFTSYRDVVWKWNSSEAIHDPTSGSVTVLAEALGVRVLFDDQGTAEGVEWRNAAGAHHEAWATRGVLLAAGAIGTPKVLMLSGIGDPFELQRLAVPLRVANREVGYGLSDHLAAFSWFVVKGEGLGDMTDPDLCINREWLNIFFNLTGPSVGDGGVDAEVRFFAGCNISRKTVDFGVEAVLLHPESTGRVFLPSARPEAMPVAEFPELWDRDVERLVEIYGKLADALPGMSLADFGEPGEDFSKAVRRGAYLYQHLCCSARAAPHGKPGVCDEDLQVRGAPGLFIADASALPFTPSSHTSAGALLVGELAARSAWAAAAAREPSRRAAALRRGQSTSVRAELLARQAFTQGLQLRKEPAPRVLLSRETAVADGVEVSMPLMALGTGTMQLGRVAGAVATFLEHGGRHVDTAVMYDNYAETHAGLVASGLPADVLNSVVFTWKVMPFGRDYVRREVHTAIKRLGLQRLDIALLHWPGDVTNGKLLHGYPLPECVELLQDAATGAVFHSWHACRLLSYEALLEEQALGRIAGVGVSNFALRHLDELAAAGFKAPAVHQMELNPILVDSALLQRCTEDGTQIQGYGLLGSKQSASGVLRNAGFRKVAEQVNKSVAQILLRWAVTMEVCAVAGGSTDEHIIENLDVFDFAFTQAQLDFFGSLNASASWRNYPPDPQLIL